MKIIQIKVGNLENFAYFVIDETSKKAAVIDPGFDFEYLIDEAKKENCIIEKILLTHSHFDHVMEAESLAIITKSTIYIHKLEEYQAKTKVVKINDGEIIPLGNLSVHCIHTPGHSKGSCVFRVEENLFTGDTLFVGGCGRTDLEGGDANSLFNSLKKIIEFPDNYLIYPGHDYGTAKKSTIKDEKKYNKCLRFQKIKS